jgi:hypothetical protein
MNKPVSWKTHLPALALIVVMLGVVAAGWPWPEPIADGFDAQGHPVHWKGGAESLFGALFGALMLWLVFFAFDGFWDLLERDRTYFNPLSLVDEGLIAWMLVRVADAGVAHGMSPALRAAAWAAGALALATAGALELSRGVAEPRPEVRPAEDVTDFASGLAALHAPGQRWSYWSVQRPPHPWLIGSLGPIFIIGSVAIPDGPVAARVLLLAAGLLVLAVYSGGFCTVVTPRRLVVRAGRFGPPLLRLATTEIVEVAVPQTVSLSDFLGWGIGFGFRGDLAGALAFNLGSSGVLVRTSKGSRYLIGTDRPERLATALNAARRTA